MAESTDFTMEGEGTVYLLKPNTEQARTWVDEHIGADNGYQPYYPTVVIEHRYVEAIVDGLVNDGLTIL